jgi:TctA family transporter
MPLPIGLWVKMISVPYHRLYPAILMFCAIGVFSLNNSEFDVWMMAAFGLFGYICAKLGAEPAPMLLGFVIGPMMEEYLRRALLLSRSDPMVFVERPISANHAGPGAGGPGRGAAAVAAEEARGSVS